MQTGVSFFTCCYEADWEYLLVQGRLKQLTESFNYPFATRCLIINNVHDKEKVRQHALQAQQEKVIDDFYFSEEFVDRVFNRFNLTRKSFKLDGFDGYWFSIAPFTSLFVCTTSHLLYFTADCMLKENYASSWINTGIDKLTNGNLLIASPLWDYYNSNSEKFDREDQNFFYDKGFTDQAFLVDTLKAQNIDFNEYHVRSEMFPIYGGNHFERRVCSYMNNHGIERCIFKDIVFKHEMLIKPGYTRKIGGSYAMNKLRYTIARVKKKLRKKNILLKLLLR